MGRFIFLFSLTGLLILGGCDSTSNEPQEITCPIEPLDYMGDYEDFRTLLYVRVENTSDKDIKIKSDSITWEFQDVDYRRAEQVQDYQITTPIETGDQELELGTEPPESRGLLPDAVFPEDVTPQVDDNVHSVVSTGQINQENIRIVENNLTCEVQ